jgi:hypothetical protein
MRKRLAASVTKMKNMDNLGYCMMTDFVVYAENLTLLGRWYQGDNSGLDALLSLEYKICMQNCGGDLRN